VVPSLRVFVASGHPGTYLLPHSVAVTDPVSVAGDRGTWSISTCCGNHSSTAPRHTRDRLAYDALEPGDDKLVDIEFASLKIMA
jgi:hypothetical protein